jgi:hypothetical protein
MSGGYVHGATRGRRLGPGVRPAIDIETEAATERARRRELREQHAAIRAWTVRNQVTRREYDRTRSLVDWFAAEPWGTREIARRHANTLDTAPPSA